MKNLSMTLALLLGACGGSAPPPGANLAGQHNRSTSEAETTECEGSDGACAQASLLAADDALQGDVQARGINAAFTEALAGNATFFATLQPLLKGKPAIVAYLQQSFPTLASGSLTWITARGEASAHEDLGYTFGWVIFTGPNGIARPGHYMAMWRREKKGEGRGWLLESYLRIRSAPRTPPPAWFGPAAPPEDEGDGVNEQKELSVLEARDADFAALSVSQGQQVSQAIYAAPDAVEMLNDAVFGRDAIVASHAHDQGTSLNWWPTGGVVARSGDIGYTIGNYDFTVTAVTPTAHYPGHYLTIWKRQPDGQWDYIVGAGAYSLL